ncbi:MAG: hypothetical protein ABIH35_02385 [Patescibacteria group bacterium]
MNALKSHPVFTIQRIRNRNPQHPRIFRNTTRRLWQFGIVLLLAISSIAFLLIFTQSFSGAGLHAKASNFLGDGFKDTAGFEDTAENPQLDSQGSPEHKESGVGTINATLYNVKDFFKYAAGGIAILYLLIAALQLVTANSDERIQKGKKNLKWSIVALVSVFIIDVAVVAIYEGGGTGPAQSLFSIDSQNSPVENTGLMENIAKYFQREARALFTYIKYLAGAFALLFIFTAGAHMISASGNEENIEKEKKYLINAITAFVVLLMVDQFIFGFIYPSTTGGMDGVTSPECVEFMQMVENSGDQADLTKIPEGCTLSASALGTQGSAIILKIVKFFTSLIGSIAVFFIVYSGVAIISSFGNEEQLNKHKKTLFWSLAGLALILLSYTLVNEFFFVVNTATGDAEIVTAVGISTLANVTNFLATFIGVFSVISIIVAGILWVANFGNTEVAEKSKKVILGAIVGVILSVAAFAIVNSLIAGNPEGSSRTSIDINIGN